MTSINKLIENLNSTFYYNIRYKIHNVNSQIYVYKFHIIKSCLQYNNSSSKIEFTITFNKTDIFLEVKIPNRNSVNVCERDSIAETSYENLDPNYLLRFVENLIKN